MEKNFLTLALNRFEQLRMMCEKTLDQLSEEDVHWSPDPESNSIAVIVQHLHGNMMSRFTDFLTTDGEKPTRNRDQEFIERRESKTILKTKLNDGWDCVFAAIRPLTEADLPKLVYIRGEEHTVMEAIIRQLVHFGYHVGQIVYIGKHLRETDWQTLSIARGRSEEYRPAQTQK